MRNYIVHTDSNHKVYEFTQQDLNHQPPLLPPTYGLIIIYNYTFSTTTTKDIFLLNPYDLQIQCSSIRHKVSRSLFRTCSFHIYCLKFDFLVNPKRVRTPYFLHAIMPLRIQPHRRLYPFYNSQALVVASLFAVPILSRLLSFTN